MYKIWINQLSFADQTTDVKSSHGRLRLEFSTYPQQDNPFLLHSQLRHRGYGYVQVVLTECVSFKYTQKCSVIFLPTEWNYCLQDSIFQFELSAHLKHQQLSMVPDNLQDSILLFEQLRRLQQ